MDAEVVELLNTLDGGSEAARITTYRFYLNSNDVIVNVLDHGAATAELRYIAEAYWAHLSPEKRTVVERGYSIGNPDPTIKGAILNVHWNALG